MEKNTITVAAPAAVARLAVLFAGPLASWIIVQTYATNLLAPGEIGFVALALALVWSPLFFSVPALMLQRERDRLIPAPGGAFASLARGVRLVPAMLASGSPIRTETMASLVGWAALLIASAPMLITAVQALA